jgi:tripartite-type tricarboxylate transporter receptor subunit TctC
MIMRSVTRWRREDETKRTMVAPPGVPADRVKLLREAYTGALKDPDLIAEVDRQRLDMEPSSGEEIQALHRDLIDQKRDVIERVKTLLEN